MGGAKKIEGGYAGEGKEDKMRGGCENKMRVEGGFVGSERVKKMKCGGGGLLVNLKVGGMPERVQKTKCRRVVAEKN